MRYVISYKDLHKSELLYIKQLAEKEPNFLYSRILNKKYELLFVVSKHLFSTCRIVSAIKQYGCTNKLLLEYISFFKQKNLGYK